jgi:hypothetical protein
MPPNPHGSRLPSASGPFTMRPTDRGRSTDAGALPDPRFRDYWPHVESHLRFTSQDTGSVENYRVCWREVETLDDALFGNLGDLPLRSWTRATAIRAPTSTSRGVVTPPTTCTTPTRASCSLGAPT